MEQNFKIDFLMLEKLAEACFSGKTILEYLVLQELVDKHFETMSESNRKAFFDYFSRKYRTDGKFLDGETDFINGASTQTSCWQYHKSSLEDYQAEVNWLTY